MPADDVTLLVGGLSFQVEGTGFAWSEADVLAMTARQAERYVEYVSTRAERLRNVRRS